MSLMISTAIIELITLGKRKTGRQSLKMIGQHHSGDSLMETQPLAHN